MELSLLRELRQTHEMVNKNKVSLSLSAFMRSTGVKKAISTRFLPVCATIHTENRQCFWNSIILFLKYLF